MSRYSMILVGDVHVDRADPPSMFRHVRPLLTAADAVLGNLEIVFAAGGKPERAKPLTWANFKSPPHNVSAVKGLFSAMSLASNHTLDYGEEALLECLQILEREKIPFSGSGRNLRDAERAAVVTVAGTRIALIGATCLYVPGWEATEDRLGASTVKVKTVYEPPLRVLEQPASPPIVRTIIEPEEIKRLEAVIQRARAEADVVVFSIHWGVSQQFRRVVDYQRVLGKILIDLGVDIVFGHHPHVIQGVEVYKGKPIAYSLGNFAFDLGLKDDFDFTGLTVWADMDGRTLKGISLIPVNINDNNEPEPCNDADARVILDQVIRMSKEYGTPLGETRVNGRLALQVGLG